MFVNIWENMVYYVRNSHMWINIAKTLSLYHSKHALKKSKEYVEIQMKDDFDLENRKEARKQLIYKILLTVVEIAIVIFAGFAITHIGMVTYTVSGQSMAPTLKNGDKILVNKISYHLHSVKRNDVVVVEQSGSEHNYYTSVRIIGLPGEKVQIKDGKVYIDGNKLNEKYHFQKMENGGLTLEAFYVR